MTGPRYSRPEQLPAIAAVLDRARETYGEDDLANALQALLDVSPVKVGDVVRSGVRMYRVVHVRVKALPHAGEPVPYVYTAQTREGGRWTGARVLLAGPLEVIDPSRALPAEPRRSR